MSARGSVGLLALASVLLATAPCDGQVQPTPQPAISNTAREFRKHFVAVTAKGVPLYMLTEITQMMPDLDRNLVLLRDESGNEFLMEHLRDYFRQETTFEIRDTRRKTFVKNTSAYPYKSKSRDDTLAELKANPKLLKADVTITIETPGFVHSAKESEWKEFETARELRSQIRQSLDPAFVEELEKFRGGLLSEDPVLSTFCNVVVAYVLHGEVCEESKSIELKSASPDCLFDLRFGFACSEKQKQRVTTAEVERRGLDFY